jgi:hypothetical protein
LTLLLSPPLPPPLPPSRHGPTCGSYTASAAHMFSLYKKFSATFAGRAIVQPLQQYDEIPFAGFRQMTSRFCTGGRRQLIQ